MCIKFGESVNDSEKIMVNDVILLGMCRAT